MLSNRYTFGELNEILMESHKNEFKPRIGKNVERDDKQNNRNAVDDILKQSKKFDGGMSDRKRNTNKEDIQDYNKTTLDVNFASKPSKEYISRVRSQVHGFPSEYNEKNSKIKDENESLDFDGNEDFYDLQKKKSEEVNDMAATLKHAGLKARMLPKNQFKNDTLFKENKTMKRLHFKNTVFLSESQMLNKVPSEFKSENGRFIMKDATGTEYLVECAYDSKFKHGKLTVINKINKKQINEQLNRMKQLFDYDSAQYMGGTTTESRKSEEIGLSEMINHVKDIETEGLK